MTEYLLQKWSLWAYSKWRWLTFFLTSSSDWHQNQSKRISHYVDKNSRIYKVRDGKDWLNSPGPVTFNKFLIELLNVDFSNSFSSDPSTPKITTWWKWRARLYFYFSEQEKVYNWLNCLGNHFVNFFCLKLCYWGSMRYVSLVHFWISQEENRVFHQKKQRSFLWKRLMSLWVLLDVELERSVQCYVIYKYISAGDSPALWL